MSLSMDIIAKWLSLSCAILDLKNVFINLSFEKDLSPDATDTGSVKKIRIATAIFGNVEIN